ncbi:MAG TPA: protein kinase [Labilithrix sp.]|nr:protein kinase [Labilithrix sp.]
MAEGPGTGARRLGTMVRDKYRIDAFIATGSMASVYAATHRNGSRVALKILHRDFAHDPSMGERFRREGYFANAIGHPGVVRAIDDDVTEDGCAFLVMDLLEGETLEERRKRLGGKIPPSELLPVADAVLDILAAAHDQNVLHRDLKPENVFITRKNEVKLLDFGVARFNDGQSWSDMTGVGMVLGTPAFMPPEQALGRREEVDARSDIWSLGATLFTALTGEAVHAGRDAKAKLIATARTRARPLNSVAPDVPRAVAAAIDRALAFDKVERWEDANAMREALRWARMAMGDAGPATVIEAAPETLGPATPKRAYDKETLELDRSAMPRGVATSTGRDAPMPATEREPVPTLPDAGASELRNSALEPESPTSEESVALIRAALATTPDRDHQTQPHLDKIRTLVDPTQAMVQQSPEALPLTNTAEDRPTPIFALPSAADLNGAPVSSSPTLQGIPSEQAEPSVLEPPYASISRGRVPGRPALTTSLNGTREGAVPPLEGRPASTSEPPGTTGASVHTPATSRTSRRGAGRTVVPLAFGVVSGLVIYAAGVRLWGPAASGTTTPAATVTDEPPPASTPSTESSGEVAPQPSLSVSPPASAIPSSTSSSASSAAPPPTTHARRTRHSPPKAPNSSTSTAAAAPSSSTSAAAAAPSSATEETPND